jgi:hypothetical protein
MGSFGNQLSRLLLFLAAGCSCLALVAASAAAAPPQDAPGLATAASAGEASPGSPADSVPASPPPAAPQPDPAATQAPTAPPAPAPAASPSAPSAPETGATTETAAPGPDAAVPDIAAAAPSHSVPDLGAFAPGHDTGVGSSLPALNAKTAAPEIQAPKAPIDTSAVHPDSIAPSTPALGSAAMDTELPGGLVGTTAGTASDLAGQGGDGIESLTPVPFAGQGVSGSGPEAAPVTPKTGSIAPQDRSGELSGIAAADPLSSGTLSSALYPSARSAPVPTDVPSHHPAPSDAPVPGAPDGVGPSGGIFFFGFAALLLGLLGFAAPALSRRLQGIPASWRPAPYLSLLERPG